MPSQLWDPGELLLPPKAATPASKPVCTQMDLKKKKTKKTESKITIIWAEEVVQLLTALAAPAPFPAFTSWLTVLQSQGARHPF